MISKISYQNRSDTVVIRVIGKEDTKKGVAHPYMQHHFYAYIQRNQRAYKTNLSSSLWPTRQTDCSLLSSRLNPLSVSLFPSGPILCQKPLL